MEQTIGYFVLAASIAAPVITATACVVYAMRRRSRNSAALAVAACTVVVFQVAGRAFSLLVVPRMTADVRAGQNVLIALNLAYGVVYVIVSLAFSGTLYFALREASRPQPSANPSDPTASRIAPA